MNEQSRNSSVSTLLVGDYSNERRLVHQVCDAMGWQLLEAPDRRVAMRHLRASSVGVVVAQAETPNWNWKEILQDLRNLNPSPQLVVASRTADDYLWSEVLNVGGFDVLPQPFDRDEFERVMASAYRHFARPVAPVRSLRFASVGAA